MTIITTLSKGATMKRIFHITVTIAMFALLPAVLLAQDELTLESLTETVAGLTERIEVIGSRDDCTILIGRYSLGLTHSILLV